MSTLPPCQHVLKLHVLRSCYVAAIWKRPIEAKRNLPDITSYGWKSNGSIQWTDDIYPDEVKDVLFHDNYDGTEFFNDEGESDDEENY